MKLSEQTREILSHFATQGTNFVFKVGKHQAMYSEGKSRLVEAEIEESISVQAGIYDFKKFVSCMKSFDEPDLTFEEHYASLSEGGVEAKFCLSALEGLVYPKTELVFEANGLVFNLSETSIKQIVKFLRVMDYKYMAIEAIGGKTTLRIQSSSTPDNDQLEINLGLSSKNFSVLLNVKDLSLIADDYEIHLSAKKIVKFQSTRKALTYYLAADLVTFDTTEVNKVSE
jgi:hypothetical protein